MIKSFFDETLLSDLENISEFLIDIKTEINELKLEMELEEQSNE